MGVGDRQGIQVVGKERLVYREGENWYEIECAWGVDPSSAFIPSAEKWNDEVPAWLKERRESVVAALEKFGAVVRSDETEASPFVFGTGKYQSQWPKSPSVTVLGPYPLPPRNSTREKSFAVYLRVIARYGIRQKVRVVAALCVSALLIFRGGLLGLEIVAGVWIGGVSLTYPLWRFWD